MKKANPDHVLNFPLIFLRIVLKQMKYLYQFRLEWRDKSFRLWNKTAQKDKLRFKSYHFNINKLTVYHLQAQIYDGLFYKIISEFKRIVTYS